MNKTILQKIEITDTVVHSWLKKGVKISYPMLQNKKYYRSEDGFAFVENGDKYVIPLSKKEIDAYTKSPLIFKNNFFRNLRLYVKFIDWLHFTRLKTESLEPKEKFVSLLLILYLFQRGMDYHYYHFDRYLVYQNYPDTPVGFWWQRLKKLCKNETVKMLHLLADDIESKKIIQSLDKKEQREINKILINIKIFEAAQQMEIKMVTDFASKENRLFRTAIPIWNNLMDLLKKYPNLLKSEFQNKLPEITEGHPLIMTRVILSPNGLNYFQPHISKIFEDEIKRWIKR